MMGTSTICLENTYWVTRIKEQANGPAFRWHRNQGSFEVLRYRCAQIFTDNFAPTISCLSPSPVSFQIPGRTIWLSLGVSAIECISHGQGMEQHTQSWPLGRLRAALHDYEYDDRFAIFYFLVYLFLNQAFSVCKSGVYSVCVVSVKYSKII